VTTEFTLPLLDAKYGRSAQRLIWEAVRAVAQMEHHLEAMIATSGNVFCDRGDERTTHPCEPLKLHSAMLVALQQRRVQALKPILHPMRCAQDPMP
jgi:hypothetical protein